MLPSIPKNRYHRIKHLGVEAVYYSRGGGLNSQSSVSDADKNNYLAATVSVPITYRISEPLWITGEVGYKHAASTIAGQ